MKAIRLLAVVSALFAAAALAAPPADAQSSPQNATRISLEGVPPGVHHYRVIGFTKEHLVADIYCPSIIVN